MIRKILVRGAIGILVIALIAIAAFVIWGSTPLGPAETAQAALTSDDRVAVSHERWLSFQPVGQSTEVGLIFYPGGRVDPRAYAPLARAIAAEGYQVVLVTMPLNLAVFGADRADAVIDAYPDIRAWVIGGHSLGGAMAARYTYRNPQAIGGLVLWAAYPAESNSLRDQATLAVTSIYATRDGLATPDKIEASRSLLPPQTRWVAIEGGNHAQFGAYGEQQGDLPATLSAEAQHQQVVAATLDLLQAVKAATTP